jgi:hypothetical protein
MAIDLGDKDMVGRIVADQSLSVARELSAYKSAPARSSDMLQAHLQAPWVPNLITVLISPLMPTLRAYLRMSMARMDGRIWYFPSFLWWSAHARAAHAPDGTGCDIEAHKRQLLPGMAGAQFLVGHLLKDGQIRILAEEDFKTEQDWFKHNFPEPGR